LKNTGFSDVTHDEQVPEAGKLIVVIPTADGLVVAADSRDAIRRFFTDNRKKLHVVNTRRPVVFAITGASDFPYPCPPKLNLSEWTANPDNYAFRTSTVVRMYLEQRPDFSLTEASLEEAAVELAGAVYTFIGSNPPKIEELAGRDLCVLLICQVKDSGDSIVGSVGFRVASDGSVHPGQSSFWQSRILDELFLQTFGEWKYEWGEGTLAVPSAR
jgi:hypothetical protein